MKRTLVLVISLVVGLAAAILTRVYVSVKDAEIREQKEALNRRYGTLEVLVFAKDIPTGTVLSATDLEPRLAPKLGLRGQAILRENLRDVVGRKVLLGHEAGEVAFWSDIDGGNPAERGLSADLKPKMRAISINCSGAAAVSGMVKPNDHVDVIGTFAFPGADGKIRNGDIETRTILQNVLVLATGQTTAKTNVGEGDFMNSYSTVTLEVSPREAEMLVFAEQMKGRLVLTLRSRTDVTYEKELPKVDFELIKSEIEALNMERQRKLGGR
jgi:pilus assembly protein CpaB